MTLRLLGLGIRIVAQELLLLVLLTLQSPLTCRLVLRTLGIHLILDLTLTQLLGLGLVDLKGSQYMFEYGDES